MDERHHPARPGFAPAGGFPVFPLLKWALCRAPDPRQPQADWRGNPDDA